MGSEMCIRDSPLKRITGGKETRVDGPAIRDFAHRNAHAITLILFIYGGAFLTILGWFSAPAYASFAALVAHAAVGRHKGLTRGECFRIALAAVSAKIVIDTLFKMNARFMPITGVALYAGLVAILTIVAIARIRPTPTTLRHDPPWA